ncbi:hypothetical protein LOTGIDRAFT_142801 [Lottia gigantea]|uniref:RING finger protein 207 n=1 Tax=Lottia gigantea TaxID=225164 RepID=V4C9T5_LOTGI|nr:hypothetical protein LOTGIDRAFT_142801 [Lottia gigantea]ESO98529.1 hypothetical protein LOTGIDRAFT_142801 [Lottia gigantea]
MSGEIFQPLENLELVDLSKSNPLLCYLCNEQYDDPCILACFHSFCAQCLRGRCTDSRMTCPLCGAVTTLKDGASLPAADLLLKFMVESSLDERAQCANCDNETEHMYFCNTCNQPLCTVCREVTHQAKMFSAHDIVLLSKRTKDIHKKCSLHGEPYIMFSSEKKIMLCIKCFRDMRVESRTHCVDMETAYNQSCKKLDQSVQTIRDLQKSASESIGSLKGLVEEVKINRDREAAAVSAMYDAMMEKINKTKTDLLEEVDKQFQEKEGQLKAQLHTLMTLLPTLHVHFMTSAAFSSSANRFEFLDLAYVMMGRLKAITRQPHPLHPLQTSIIDTDFKGQFARNLEPLLFSRPGLSSLSNASLPIQREGRNTPVIYKMNSAGSSSRRSNNNGLKVKFIDAKGPFADYCKEFETVHKDLLVKCEKLKIRVQELQRDLTLRRCLTRNDDVSTIRCNIEEIDKHLANHYSNIDNKQSTLQEHWEDSLQRIGNEQELYQAQLQDITRLQHECQHLNTIMKQLSSFVLSITAVTERIDPK